MTPESCSLRFCPEKALPCKSLKALVTNHYRMTKFTRLFNEAGIVPFNRLVLRVSLVIRIKLLKPVGIGPVKSLLDKSSSERFRRS